MPGAARPRVLADRVEAGPGEVQAGRAPVRADDLRLEPGQDPQRLRVALEAADRVGDRVQRVLAVVPERRVAEVVGQAGGVDDVGIGAELGADLAADLGHLERVGQPGAREVVLARADDLGLGRQAAKRERVQHPGPVAGELAAPAGLGDIALVRLGELALRRRTRHRTAQT